MVKKYKEVRLLLVCNRHLTFELPYLTSNYRVSCRKGINKKLLIGHAHGFNSQFLNLFGFKTSVSFVQCIIRFGRIQIKLQQYFGDVCVLKACKFSRRTAIKFQKCLCVTLFGKFVTDYHLRII